MNRKYNERDNLLFGENFDKAKYPGGISRFEKLTLEELEVLFEKDFIDPNDAYNECPSAGEFYEFMKKYPTVTAHGYAVSPERSDYGITIEGLECDKSIDIYLEFDFAKFCQYADELTVTDVYLWSWWD